MYSDKLTANERRIVMDAMYCSIGDLEYVHNILGNMWESNFGQTPQSAINEYSATVIGSTLYLCWDKISDILRQYALTVGDETPRIVTAYLEDARTAMKAIDVEREIDAIEKRERHMSDDDSKKSRDTRDRIMDLSDEQALPLLKALCK